MNSVPVVLCGCTWCLQVVVVDVIVRGTPNGLPFRGFLRNGDPATHRVWGPRVRRRRAWQSQAVESSRLLRRRNTALSHLIWGLVIWYPFDFAGGRFWCGTQHYRSVWIPATHFSGLCRRDNGRLRQQNRLWNFWKNFQKNRKKVWHPIRWLLYFTKCKMHFIWFFPTN